MSPCSAPPSPASMATASSFANSTFMSAKSPTAPRKPSAVGERAELLAKRLGRIGHRCLPGQDPNDNDGVGVFRARRGFDHGPRPIGRRQKPGDPTGENDMFYSMHPHGVNFVFATPHVAFLTSDTDLSFSRTVRPPPAASDRRPCRASSRSHRLRHQTTYAICPPLACGCRSPPMLRTSHRRRFITGGFAVEGPIAEAQQQEISPSWPRSIAPPSPTTRGPNSGPASTALLTI